MAFGHNDVCLLGLLGKINKKDGIFAYSDTFCAYFGNVKAFQVDSVTLRLIDTLPMLIKREYATG